EDFPHAGIAAPHHIASRIPLVEIADDGHELGIGRPHGETNSLDAFESGAVGAEGPPGFVESTFSMEVKIEVRDDGSETIRIFDDAFHILPVADAEAVGAGLALQVGDEEAIAMAFLH